jgi:hypothetical protein
LYDTIGLVNCLYGMLQHRKVTSILTTESDLTTMLILARVRIFYRTRRSRGSESSKARKTCYLSEWYTILNDHVPCGSVFTVNQKSLTSALEHSERENALAIERLKSYHREFQEARRQWDHEKGDMQREIANLQHRDNQFQVYIHRCQSTMAQRVIAPQHELRKRDRDIEKLQKRLQASVGDRSKDTRGMEVTGPAAAKAAAAKAKTVTCDEECVAIEA